MAVYITFVAVNVNAMSRGAAVTIGEVLQSGWTQSGKTNFGSGQLFGRNVVSGFVNQLSDNDFIDNPIGSLEPSNNIQTQTL